MYYLQTVYTSNIRVIPLLLTGYVLSHKNERNLRQGLSLVTALPLSQVDRPSPCNTEINCQAFGDKSDQQFLNVTNNVRKQLNRTLTHQFRASEKKISFYFVSPFTT
jgi:hypothetical protein